MAVQQSRATNNARTHWQSGFTIVELLIVVVVIAILAAITIVAYNGVSYKAKASAAQSAAAQAAKKARVYAVANGENFPSALSDADVRDSDSTSFQYKVDNSATPKYFCVTATTSNVSFFVNNTTNTTPTAGACPGHGANGILAITNLANDPAASSLNNIGNGRWSNDRYSAYGTYSIEPLTGGPAGLTSMARFRVTTGGSVAIGFHLAGNSDGSPVPSTAIPVSGSTTYTVSTYARWTGTSGQTLYLIVRFMNSSGAWITTSEHLGTTAATSGTWYRISGTVTAPADATGMSLALRRGGSTSFASTDTLDGTGLMITEGATLYNFAYGGSNGWAWNGGSGNATSSGPPL